MCCSCCLDNTLSQIWIDEAFECTSERHYVIYGSHYICVYISINKLFAIDCMLPAKIYLNERDGQLQKCLLPLLGQIGGPIFKASPQSTSRVSFGAAAHDVELITHSCFSLTFPI